MQLFVASNDTAGLADKGRVAGVASIAGITNVANLADVAGAGVQGSRKLLLIAISWMIEDTRTP